MTKVKICGITNLEDALLAADAGADALGFIFAESPRMVKKETARDIIRRLPPFIARVGVFVNSPGERIWEIVSFCGLDYVQLHGDETPDYCRGIRYRPVIKAFRIEDEGSIKDPGLYSCAAAFLLDTFSKDRFGGTGMRFDHALAIKAKESGKPIILSGGVNPDNAAEAVIKVTPYAIDSSSGVESAPGKKDPELLTRLIHTVKAIR